MITLRDVDLVRALATHRHFGRAATTLGITQSALSRALQSLEAALGVRLFDRGYGKPELTEFGRIMLEWSEPVVRSMGDLVREINLAKGLEAGELTVSVGAFPSELWAPEAIGRLSDEFPNLQCHLRIGDGRAATNDVLKNHSDLAIADLAEASEHLDLMTEKFASVRVVIFCRTKHPLTTRSSLKLEEVLSFPWVGPRLPANISHLLPGTQYRAGTVDPTTGRFMPRIWVEAFSSMRHVVRASTAISWAPSQLVAPYLEAGELAELSIDGLKVNIEFGIEPLHKRPQRSWRPCAHSEQSRTRGVFREGSPPTRAGPVV
jgi:DNA-binding transcriptional LysR family regulator